jgi:PAS domain S-box-containing protein
VSDVQQDSNPEIEHIESALEEGDSCVWAVDLETGETMTQVGSSETVFGTPATELKDMPSFFANAVHPDDLPEVEQVYRQVTGGETERINVEFRTHPDYRDIRWIEVRGRLETNGETQWLIGTATDVTERKRREQELEQQKQRLEEFTAVLSHDLRNPLQMAAGHIELAKKEASDDHLAAVDRALAQMDELIDDLLSSIDEGGPIIRGGGTQQIDTVDIATLAESCWETIAPDEATLHVETDQAICADEKSLQQLLENLLRNAVEHAGSDVTVTVGELDDGTGFYVADDGPGILESEREDIFEMQYSQASGGFGLGLHIVSEIVESLGWTITVTESDTDGARFEISGVSTDRKTG